MRYLLGILLALRLPAAPADLERARQLYQRTDYRAALEILNQAPKSAEASALAGKSWYGLGEYKKAIDCFERALGSNPNDARLLNWLGRAWGRRAESANPLMAPSYAVKTRESFERAVQANPRDIEAMNDLFSYYMDAPGFLGGGLDKAAALAERMKSIDEGEYYLALARIAEKRKDHPAAEQRLRKAVELVPRQAGRFVELGKFLARRGRISEAWRTFEEAAKAEPANPQVAFAWAETRIETGREIEVARKTLQAYLAMPLTPDDPSREEARRLLKRAGD